MGVEEDERKVKGEPIWKNFDYGLEKLKVGRDNIVYGKPIQLQFGKPLVRIIPHNHWTLVA